VENFITALAQGGGPALHRWDERLTSREAGARLGETGSRPRREDGRNRRHGGVADSRGISRAAPHADRRRPRTGSAVKSFFRFIFWCLLIAALAAAAGWWELNRTLAPPGCRSPSWLKKAWASARPSGCWCARGCLRRPLEFRAALAWRGARGKSRRGNTRSPRRPARSGWSTCWWPAGSRPTR